ncbi:hypothetical protein ACTMTI_22175 [Nonomuraea sp. H19]|uniref:hypothetical protein n=1 Tax=Nonomuraea sp. H19 TaxID=3452206 RepID=UPI003F8B3637
MSAIVLALGLTGAGAAPFIMQSASASVTAAFDPPVEPCDVGDTTCETTPETTVTVTTTLGSPTPEESPETTITTTVTATPTKATKTPTPKKTTSAPATTQAPSTPTQNLQPVPSQSVEVPPTTAETTPEQSVQMPTVAPETSAPVLPTETEVASSEEVPLELRGAAPEFDQRTLTQKLSIPALVLVLLALFAVLIFEGRLRRMAHAAAVRKAGPQHMGGRPDMPPPGGGYPTGPGYPAGPGYVSAGFPAPGYPGGTAYAPIISFVPVQTYPSGPVVYQDPGQPYPPQGYAQEPSAEPPVVLHPDEFDSYNHEPPKAKEYRDPFEPLVPPAEPPADIPPGGASSYEDGQEHPLGPIPAAEPGDSEPWQEGRSLFEPAQSAAEGYEPPPYLPADEDVTAVQPMPQQEPTKEMPDSTRKRFRRSK